ncbi:MAG: hypothetical protein WKG07_46035 [Hymenobacter sp.]
MDPQCLAQLSDDAVPAFSSPTWLGLPEPVRAQVPTTVRAGSEPLFDRLVGHQHLPAAGGRRPPEGAAETPAGGQGAGDEPRSAPGGRRALDLGLSP